MDEFEFMIHCMFTVSTGMGRKVILETTVLLNHV